MFSKVLLMGVALGFYHSAYAVTVQEVVKKIDYNQSPDSVIYDGKLIINKAGKVSEKITKIWGSGGVKTFVEFLSPPRDKGTKYLRLEDNVWIYMPSVEKTVKIAKHQLREGMAGSDFSYEDQTERVKLLEKYDGVLKPEEEFLGRKMYVLSLTLKPNIEATYYNRVIWVDKEQFVAYKSEMYAKSGKLLKVLSVKEVQKVGDRYYPVKLTMEDKLKTNSFTDMELTKISIDVKLSEEIFTLKNLEKKN